MKKPVPKDIALCRTYRAFFTSEEGRRIYDDLMKQYPPDAPRFSHAGKWSGDPIAAAFRDGQRAVTEGIRRAVEAGRLLPDQPTE